LEGLDLDPSFKKNGSPKISPRKRRGCPGKGPDMKKREFFIPPGNIAMYLLKNLV
jgi:hypothetical protein